MIDLIVVQQRAPKAISLHFAKQCIPIIGPPVPLLCNSGNSFDPRLHGLPIPTGKTQNTD